jgi:hypothetical protein
MITRALNFYYTIFLEDIIYIYISIYILTRQERERLELELDNQVKTYREISKVSRIAACGIGLF